MQVAARAMQVESSGRKREALLAAAASLETSAERILEANAVDVAAAEAAGVTATVIDRLRLNDDRIANMAASVRTVAELSDPVGEIVEGRVPKTAYKSGVCAFRSA